MKFIGKRLFFSCCALINPKMLVLTCGTIWLTERGKQWLQTSLFIFIVVSWPLTGSAELWPAQCDYGSWSSNSASDKLPHTHPNSHSSTSQAQRHPRIQEVIDFICAHLPGPICESLSDATIRVEDTEGDLGRYYPRTDTIVINSCVLEEFGMLVGVLVHEIHHYIHDHEQPVITPVSTYFLVLEELRTIQETILAILELLSRLPEEQEHQIPGLIDYLDQAYSYLLYILDLAARLRMEASGVDEFILEDARDFVGGELVL